MKKILLALLIIPYAQAENLSLICTGDAKEKNEETVTTEATKKFDLTETFEMETKVISYDSFTASLYLNLDIKNKTGTLEVPKLIAKKTLSDIKELNISDNLIDGWARPANYGFRHEFSIDRRTGIINYSYKDVSLSAVCKKNEINENKF